MTVSRKWVGQVRAVIADIREAREAAPTAETEAWRAFDWNSQLLAPAPLEQTPRARRIREINRIAMKYTWGSEIERALDEAGAASLAALSDDQVEQLVERMRMLVDRAMTGCDAADALPAR